MKSILKYLWACLAMIAMASCHGYTDPATINPGGDTPTPPDSKWPNEPLAVGELRIYADKYELAANGSDMVEFHVVLGTDEGNKVVSSEGANLVIKSERDGQSNNLGRGAYTFTTAAAGAYTFTAEYYEGELFTTNNSVSIVAMPSEGDGPKFMQKVMGVQFTSTGCTSCPILSSNLKSYQEANPGRLVPVSFHQHMPPVSDPMVNTTSEVFFRHFNTQGLPRFYANMRKGSSNITSEYILIEEAIENELKNYPSTCGVAIESSYDASTRELNITGKVLSNSSQVYRYYVMLLEDGLKYEQSGSRDGDYTHNNVMRQGWPSDNATGYYIKPDGSATTPGEEVIITRKPVTLNSEWNADNMRIFFAALVSHDGGLTFTVDNCIDCKLGESVDYAYDEGTASDETLTLTADKSSVKAGEAVNFEVKDSSEESLLSTATIVCLTTGERVESGSYTPAKKGSYEFVAAFEGVVSNRLTLQVGEGSSTPITPTPGGKTNYRRHVMVYEFTGVGCSMCPGGYSTLSRLMNISRFRETVHMIAFHSNSLGDDPMHLDLTTQILQENGNMGLPSVLIDMRERGEVNAIKDNIPDYFDASLSEMPAHCGVALETNYDSATRKGKLTVKVGINEPSTYRVAAFVVEDNIIYKQKDSDGNYRDPYTHHHVVREMLSEVYTGDLLGKDLTTGDERTLTYDFTVNEAWNESNIELYAVVLDDATGQIKNMAYVAAGESVDYDLYNPEDLEE